MTQLKLSVGEFMGVQRKRGAYYEMESFISLLFLLLRYCLFFFLLLLRSLPALLLAIGWSRKRKVTGKKICPRENLSYFPFGLFSPAQKIFPLLRLFLPISSSFLGHCELHDMYKYRLAVRMLNIIYLLFKMNRCKKIVLKRKRKEHTG